MEVLAGHELEAVIGRGSFGTVWRARRTGAMARVVAVKRAAGRDGSGVGEARERLRAEAALLAELDHPHIVDVIDVLDDGDGVAIVMPLALGGSLRALLDERAVLPAGEVVAVVAPIADALASAHRRELVHGDVKPANILFTSDGEPLLSDFGAARHLGAPAGDAAIAGTAAYLDPARLDGEPPGPSNDLYALGVVCYEALLGVPPYDGTDDEILAAAARGNHHRLSDVKTVPAALAELVERAINRAPQNRPPSLERFAEELRASVDPASVRLPVPAQRHQERDGGDEHGAAGSDGVVGRHGTKQFGPRPVLPVAAAARPGRRRQVTVVCSCVLALALVLAGVVWLRADQPDPRSHSAAVPVHRRPCKRFPSLHPSPGSQRFEVDLNGDGCREPVVWDGQVLAARFDVHEPTPRYYEIGSRGDVLLFGDWNCDGRQTPALYHPAVGEVVYVNSFARRIGDKTYAERTKRHLPKRGTPLVAQGADGCQSVRITGPRS